MMIAKSYSRLSRLMAIATLIAAITILSGCMDAPSPQDTAPSKPAKCNALRAQMMQFGGQNNTSNAIQDTEQLNLQETYKNECE